MRDMVWMNSMAQADGSACSMVPPTSSQAARQSAGRTRFPPARSEYLQSQNALYSMSCNQLSGTCQQSTGCCAVIQACTSLPL